MTLSTKRKILLGINRFWNIQLQSVSLLTKRTFNKPIDITFDITSRCCLRCRMCDIWKPSNNDRGELSVSEWKKVFDDLHDWLGPFYAQFSGGEPFMKEGFLDLIEYSHRLGNYNKVVTNGFLFNEKFCDLILKSGLDSISISFDSLNPALHDYIRNTKGTHEKAKNALEYLSERKGAMKLSISTIILKQNLGELASMVQWTQDRRLNCIVFQPLEKTFEGKDQKSNWQSESEFWIDDTERLDSVLNRLITLKKQGAPIWNSVDNMQAIKRYYGTSDEFMQKTYCSVGYKNFSINASGDVKFCFLMKGVGNYFEHGSAQHIWESSEAEVLRKAIGRCERKCLLNCHQSQPTFEKVKDMIRNQ